MVNVLPKFQEISRKVIKLERIIVRLKKENDLLTQRVKELEGEIGDLQEANKDAREKYEAVKLVKSLPQSFDAEAVQEKIDLYLKEIDICLKNFGD